MGSPVRAEAGLRLAASRISYWLFHASQVEPLRSMPDQLSSGQFSARRY